MAERRTGAARTSAAILRILKAEGPADSGALAARLSVSAMAIRQHLYKLADEGLVGYETEARPVGRPAKLWRVTAASDRYFPDSHAELTVGLLGAMRETFGQEGLERLLAARSRKQAEGYRARIPARASLRRRVEALAALRSEEGYIAEARSGPDGSVLLVENHCPVCVAATSCAGLCGSELSVFREVLGPDAAVERTEHIASGARRCVYEVRPVRKGGGA